jgi:hypothetical protein
MRDEMRILTNNEMFLSLDEAQLKGQYDLEVGKDGCQFA